MNWFIKLAGCLAIVFAFVFTVANPAIVMAQSDSFNVLSDVKLSDGGGEDTDQGEEDGEDTDQGEDGGENSGDN